MCQNGALMALGLCSRSGDKALRPCLPETSEPVRRDTERPQKGSPFVSPGQRPETAALESKGALRGSEPYDLNATRLFTLRCGV
jgi:hypothetical protein